MVNKKNKSPDSTANMDRFFFRASGLDFLKIPGVPISYSASDAIRQIFAHGSLENYVDTRLGMATADNDLFIRQWFEVSNDGSGRHIDSRKLAIESKKKWFPYQKGGDYRKWYGNYDYYVNWERDGFAIQNFKDAITGKARSHNYNLDFIFRKGVTWNALTSSKTSARLSTNSIFDNAGSSLFIRNELTEEFVMGLINSNVMLEVFPLISPTLNYQPGDISKLPALFPKELQHRLGHIINRLIILAHIDWDHFETSWDFSGLPLLHSDRSRSNLKNTYQNLRVHCQEMTQEMQQLEEENNRIFIEAYGLQDELMPEVPLKEITLTCNPHYRYGGDKTEEELEALLLADTMREFLSYATGCMFGRYSLDKPGLILANQGDTLTEYLQQVPEPSFMPNQDNVIPILDGDWFTDDITERFRQFLRITFGEARYEENLAFIEAALGKDIRKYFLKDFYNDHVRRYKKRPIYWLFSSPKGSFNALIYLHSYRPDTVSVVLQYLRDFRKKLAARLDYLQQVGISPSASQSEKTRAQKEIDTIKKQLLELDDYERDTLYPLATAQIALDLDDGVKVNYLKLGLALKKIVGLDAKGED
ncbi:MAG: BREX-1 system adenine-specific DNA-methyltransferase PglX [Acidithiobacillus ferriphilus]